MSNNRPSIKISEENPGSDLAAECAAALASAAVVGRHVAKGQLMVFNFYTVEMRCRRTLFLGNGFVAFITRLKRDSTIGLK